MVSSIDSPTAMNGVFNDRDIGGVATVSGSRVRTGLVFRADGLHRAPMGSGRGCLVEGSAESSICVRPPSWRAKADSSRGRGLQPRADRRPARVAAETIAADYARSTAPCSRWCRDIEQTRTLRRRSTTISPSSTTGARSSESPPGFSNGDAAHRHEGSAASPNSTGVQLSPPGMASLRQADRSQASCPFAAYSIADGRHLCQPWPCSGTRG